MAYNLTLSDGTLLKVLSDNTADVTTTSIALVGRNYSGYGVLLNNNFLRLLENFSSGTSPNKPIAGQLWWDKNKNVLNVYVVSSTYTGWRSIEGTQVGSVAPQAPKIGDFWWDTINHQLKAFSAASVTSGSWVVIGPNAAAVQSIQPFVIQDKNNINHTVGNLLVNNLLTAVYSSDSTTFDLPGGTTVGGLSNISPGMNFTSVTQGGMINSPGFRLGVFDSNVQFQSLGAGNSINITVSPTVGTTKTAILINGTTGLATVAANATANFGVTTKIYVDSEINLANVGMKSYVDSGNTRMQTYVDDRILLANTGMKSYVDTKVGGVGGGIASFTFTGGGTGLTPVNESIGDGDTITLAGNLRANVGGTGSTSYAKGDMLYASIIDPKALAKLAIGGVGDILTVSSDLIPDWVTASSLTIGKASNLAGGQANFPNIVYQDSAGSTKYLPAADKNQVLILNGETPPKLAWKNISDFGTSSGSGGTSITGINVTNDTATATLYPLMYTGVTGTSPTDTIKITTSKLKFDAADGRLTATYFAGNGFAVTKLDAEKIDFGILDTARGGTGLGTFTASNRALYSTSATTVVAGILPTLAGGTGKAAEDLDAAGIVTKTDDQTITGFKYLRGNVKFQRESSLTGVDINEYCAEFVSSSLANVGRAVFHQNSTTAFSISPRNTSATGYAEFQWINRATGITIKTPLVLDAKGNAYLESADFISSTSSVYPGRASFHQNKAYGFAIAPINTDVSLAQFRTDIQIINNTTGVALKTPLTIWGNSQVTLENALSVNDGGTGVTEATGTGTGAKAVLSYQPSFTGNTKFSSAFFAAANKVTFSGSVELNGDTRAITQVATDDSTRVATTAFVKDVLNGNLEVYSFGVGTPASKVKGEIRATNDITAFFGSDARLKENVRPINQALDKVNRINGVYFDWTADYIDRHGGEDGYFVRKNDIGVIAQEIESVLPEIVSTREDGYKAVKYDRIVALLIQAVKELHREVEELKARL